MKSSGLNGPASLAAVGVGKGGGHHTGPVISPIVPKGLELVVRHPLGQLVRAHAMQASRAPAGPKPAPAGTQSAARDGRSVVFCSVHLIGANAVQALGHSKHPVQCLGTFAAESCDVTIAEKAAASLIAQGERDQAGTDVLQPALFANQAGLKGVAVGTGHGANLHLTAPLRDLDSFTGQIVTAAGFVHGSTWGYLSLSFGDVAIDFDGHGGLHHRVHAALHAEVRDIAVEGPGGSGWCR